MAVKRRERRGSFQAHDYAGNEFTIVVYVDVHKVMTRRDPDAEIDGLITLQTNADEPVIHDGNDRFTIVTRSGTQVTVKSQTHYVCEDWFHCVSC